jgi:N-acetylmuramoyl-L-alanine amidase
MELAEIVQAGLIESLKLENRGVRKDNFYVIRNTPMPSILVELAFISNPHEESLLSNDLFREKAANSIIEGLIKYLKNKKLEDEGSNEY